jgi:pimeloyl-ACP methyl ester carboxylesterase
MTLRRWLMPVALAVLGYAAIVLVMFLSQDQTLYPATTFTREYADAVARSEGLAPWPTAAGDSKGYVAEATTGTTVGTVIVFHGNGGAALDRAYYALALNPRGYRVLLAEYPGYGARSGSFGESSFVPDALATFDLARAEYGEPLYVVGESLGAGVASAVARDRAGSVAGVALITPWDSLPDLAQAKYPLLPARFIMNSRYDNVANLASYPGPKAVAMALNDEIIPNAHTLRLYDSLGEPKRLWRFADAGHNSWPTAPDEAWWSELVAFWATERAD